MMETPNQFAKEPPSTISDQGDLEDFRDTASTKPTTTHTVVTTNSCASVHRRGDAFTVARIEYSAEVGESIREAAEGSCDSGDGLDDKSPTGVGVGVIRAVEKSMGRLVGSGNSDGEVGLPTVNYSGIPVSPDTKKK